MRNPFKRRIKLSSESIQLPSKTRRITPQLKRAIPIKAEAELEALELAIKRASIPDNPDRIKLYAIYDRILTDSHLQSQLRTAKLSVLKSGFELTKNGKPDEVAKELLAQSWFDSFVSLALDAEFYGHSLIEFSILNADGHFFDTRIIPRQHVKPEFGIVVAEPTDTHGLAYREKATQWALIEVGDKYDLGLLQIAAKEVIVKNYARSDWSQASEKYGMPLLQIKTNTQDTKELDRLENMAQDFASNGYIILNTEDQAEMTQIGATDFYKIYLENIQHCNENISKIINGQTGTADEKAFVGSAQVHERILNDYTFSRLRKIQYVVNNQLIPFLVKWGYPLVDYHFQYTDLLPKEKTSSTDAKLSMGDIFS